MFVTYKKHIHGEYPYHKTCNDNFLKYFYPLMKESEKILNTLKLDKIIIRSMALS